MTALAGLVSQEQASLGSQNQKEQIIVLEPPHQATCHKSLSASLHIRAIVDAPHTATDGSGKELQYLVSSNWRPPPRAVMCGNPDGRQPD
jgi:hypothetical protein